MADIEVMFHHMHARLEKLTDYEMWIHVFGEIPSPGCCNYALQRTAFNNVSSYSKEATNTLLRNSYVDNVLKSVPSVRDALLGIQDNSGSCIGSCILIENDVIKFKIDLKDQQMTSQGILFAISSIYDPVGLACLFILPERRLLQGLWQAMHGWDEMVPDSICQKWKV